MKSRLCSIFLTHIVEVNKENGRESFPFCFMSCICGTWLHSAKQLTLCWTCSSNSSKCMRVLYWIVCNKNGLIFNIHLSSFFYWTKIISKNFYFTIFSGTPIIRISAYPDCVLKHISPDNLFSLYFNVQYFSMWHNRLYRKEKKSHFSCILSFSVFIVLGKGRG